MRIMTEVYSYGGQLGSREGKLEPGPKHQRSASSSPLLPAEQAGDISDLNSNGTLALTAQVALSGIRTLVNSWRTQPGKLGSSNTQHMDAAKCCQHSIVARKQASHLQESPRA